jgi:ankyrin repeat protein
MSDYALNKGVMEAVKEDFRVQLRKTLLLLACERGFWKAALLLLDCMRATGIADHALPENGCVHLATKAGHLLLLGRLLEEGADANGLWADPYTLWRQEEEQQLWQARRADSLVTDAFKSREERALRIKQASTPNEGKKMLPRGDGVAAVRAKKQGSRTHARKGPQSVRKQQQKQQKQPSTGALNFAMGLAAGLRKRSGFYGVRSCGAPTRHWQEQHWCDVGTSAASSSSSSRSIAGAPGSTDSTDRDHELELTREWEAAPTRWSAWLYYNGQHRRVGSALVSADITAVYTPRHASDKARARADTKEKAKQKVSAKARHLGGLTGGVFDTREEAAAAFDAAVRRWYGDESEGVLFNFPSHELEEDHNEADESTGGKPVARLKLTYGETVLLDTSLRGSELRRRLRRKHRRSDPGLALALGAKDGGPGGRRTLRSQWYKGAIKVGPLFYAVRHGQLAAALLLISNQHGDPATVESLQPVLTRDKAHCGRCTFRMPRAAMGDEGTPSYRPAGRTAKSSLECIGTWHWGLPVSAVSQWAGAAGIVRLPAVRASTIGFGAGGNVSKSAALSLSRPCTPAAGGPYVGAGVNADRSFGRRCFPPYDVGQPLFELEGALHMHLRMFEELGGEGEVGGKATVANRVKAALLAADDNDEKAAEEENTAARVRAAIAVQRQPLLKPKPTAAPTAAPTTAPKSVLSATAPAAPASPAGVVQGQRLLGLMGGPAAITDTAGTESMPEGIQTMTKLEMAKARRSKTPEEMQRVKSPEELDPFVQIAMAAEEAAAVRESEALEEETLSLMVESNGGAAPEDAAEMISGARVVGSASGGKRISAMGPLPKSASSAARYSASAATSHGYGYVPTAAELLEQRTLGWLLSEREELQREEARNQTTFDIASAAESFSTGGMAGTTPTDEAHRPSTSDVAAAVGRRVARMQGAQLMSRSEWIRCGAVGEAAGWRSDGVLLTCNQPRSIATGGAFAAVSTGGAFGVFERRLLKQLVEHMLSASYHSHRNKGHSLLHEEAGRAGRAAGSPGFLALLLETGLDPDVYDAHGMSPLARAVESATVPGPHRTAVVHPRYSAAPASRFDGVSATAVAARRMKVSNPKLRGADGAHASLVVGVLLKHGASVLPPQLGIEAALLQADTDASRLVKAQTKAKMTEEKQDQQLLEQCTTVTPIVVACRTGKFGGVAEVDPWGAVGGTSSVAGGEPAPNIGATMVSVRDAAVLGRVAAVEKADRGEVLDVLELLLHAMNDTHSPQAKAADISAKESIENLGSVAKWVVRRERALKAAILACIRHSRLGFQRAVLRLLGEIVVGPPSGAGSSTAAPKGALLAALKLHPATIESRNPLRYSNSCKLSRGGKRRSATMSATMSASMRGSPSPVKNGRAQRVYEHGLAPDARSETETAEFEWMCIQLLENGAVANDEADTAEENNAHAAAHSPSRMTQHGPAGGGSGVKTALQYACERGLWGLVLAMLRQVAPDGSKCVTGGGLDRTGTLRGSDKLASLMRVQQRCEPLHLAIMAGEEEVVTQMLSLGADLCAVDMQRMNAVHHVACLGERRVAGAVMLYAAPLEECDDLLVATDSRGRTPLHVAAASGHQWMVSYLLGMCQPVPIESAPSAGPNIDGGGRVGVGAIGSSETDIASTSRFFKSVLNARCAKGLSIATHATINGHMEITRMMMSEYAYDPSTEAANGDSLVLSAARVGRMDSVLWLLNLGTQAARRMKLVCDDGYTILHWAAVWGAVPLTRYLFDTANVGSKALVNVSRIKSNRNYSSSSFSSSSSSSHPPLPPPPCAHAYSFLQVQEENGHTPLHFAYAYGRREIVRLLLDNSADPDIHRCTPHALHTLDTHYTSTSCTCTPNIHPTYTSIHSAYTTHRHHTLSIHTVIIHSAYTPSSYTQHTHCHHTHTAFRHWNLWLRMMWPVGRKRRVLPRRGS